MLECNSWTARARHIGARALIEAGKERNIYRTARILQYIAVNEARIDDS